jgi:hypothetical protein
MDVQLSMRLVSSNNCFTAQAVEMFQIAQRSQRRACSFVGMTDVCCSLRRSTLASAIVALAAIVITASAVSAQSLGSAQSFAVLGATTVTNTGATVITGNAGVSPGTALTGFLPPPANTISGPGTVTTGPGLVHGTIFAAGPVAAQAHGDAGMAYANIGALPCPAGNNLSGQVLGTAVLSLGPGVYCFNSSAQLTGTLSLTGTGPWIFQIASTLTTATNSAVVVVSPGASCSGGNVFWNVGSSATLGLGTKFMGHILALTSITVTKGVSVSGSAMALMGAVTLDTNVISVCSSGTVIPPPIDKCDDDHDHGHDHDHDHDHDGDDHDKDGHHHHKHGHHHDKDDDDHDKDRDHHDKDKDYDKDHKDKGYDSKDGTRW